MAALIQRYVTSALRRPRDLMLLSTPKIRQQSWSSSANPPVDRTEGTEIDSTDISDKTVSIDRRGLGRLGYAELTEQLKQCKEVETPLGRELVAQIKARGPISVHEYMRQCLLHPVHGYYSRTGAERVIGIEGDFITAPELSRVFGDLIGVWLVSEWTALGSPSRLRVVEIGPGRGTLMADVLRATSNWPAFRRAARNIEMVEASPALRILQQRTLEAKPCSTEPQTWRLPDDDNFGTCIRWHESVPACDDINDEVPPPTLFVAHELLDAMPAHQFVRTPSGWREKLIDVDDATDSPHYFRYVLAPTTTPASAALAHSSYLKDYVADSDDNLEVSPSALAIVDDVARRIAVSRGAALFVDYGKDTCLGDSLRAFKRHRQVSALSEPGIVDLTVDTDFTSCARQAALVDGVTVFGPVQQGEWLGRMGIETRLKALLRSPYITESQVDSLIAACERLLDPSQMGARYKVLAIVNHQNQSREPEPPAGFLGSEQVVPPPDALSVIAP